MWKTLSQPGWIISETEPHPVMAMTHAPSAAAITVSQVLDLLDNEFAEVAAAAGRRGFALWLGSGISLGRVPGVALMLERVLEHLRQQINTGDPDQRFARALDSVLARSCLSCAERHAVPLDLPVDQWPRKDQITASLSDSYADVLDTRVDGELADYMLWNAVDVRATYGTIDDPDCEHLCLAILVMEGAVADLASANWDGLIERAIERLSRGEPLLQVIVDPRHLRDPTPRRSRLIKFHGCAIHATIDPDIYRPFLTGSRFQITYWPHNPTLAALRNVLVGLATNSRTLMIGLSLQDTNLQDIFAASRAANPWPWPPAPPPQGHVFCEDVIGDHQSNMLRVVYHGAYEGNREAIERSALFRAYAKQALLGLVLYVLTAKLAWLAERGCGAALADASIDIGAGVRRLRDLVAAFANGDHLAFLKAFIKLWSRGMVLFRRGCLPDLASEGYELISPLPVSDLAADPNTNQSGLAELAVGLGLLGRGEAQGKWTLSLPGAWDVDQGMFQAKGSWAAAKTSQIFFVSSATAAIELINQGALKSGNDSVFHSDNAWKKIPELGGGSGTRRSPSGGVRRRTGRLRPRHVSMRDLIRDATDIASLSQRFEEEMTL